jgi:methanethiol S-methyltransferase
MPAILGALYSALVYVFFLATFVYAIGFVENVGVPKTIDSGVPGGTLPSLLIDAALLSVFALQHSIMARRSFKRAWTRIVPESMERSTFVLFATLALALVCWQWRPLPQRVWSVESPQAAAALVALSWCGWGVLLLSTFLISHFQLFGLSQGFSRALRRSVPVPQFDTPLFYRWIRHPIYAGFILAFWATPRMSAGHLAFALLTTGYILVGIWFEERDLVAQFGERYRHYRASVGMLLPKLRTGATRDAARPGRVGLR